MKKKLTVFLLYNENNNCKILADELSSNVNIHKIIFISGKDAKSEYNLIKSANPFDSQTIRKISKNTKTDFALLQILDRKLLPGQFFIERFLAAAQGSSAGLIYSDYYEKNGNELNQHPLIEYQTGSIRDDFDFGGFVLVENNILQKAAKIIKNDLKYSALYFLRLAISGKKIFSESLNFFIQSKMLMIIRLENDNLTMSTQ